MGNRRRGRRGLRHCQSPARREQQRSADDFQHAPHSIFPCWPHHRRRGPTIETHPLTNRYVCLGQYRSPAAPSKCCGPVKHIQDGQWLPSIAKDAGGLRSDNRGGFRRSLPPLRRGSGCSRARHVITLGDVCDGRSPTVNSVRGTARESGETTRHLRVLFIAILVIPVALIIASAWLNYDAAFRGAHDRVAHAADAIHEYALKI